MCMLPCPTYLLTPTMPSHPIALVACISPPCPAFLTVPHQEPQLSPVSPGPSPRDRAPHVGGGALVSLDPFYSTIRSALASGNELDIIMIMISELTKLLQNMSTMILDCCSSRAARMPFGTVLSSLFSLVFLCGQLLLGLAGNPLKMVVHVSLRGLRNALHVHLLQSTLMQQKRTHHPSCSIRSHCKQPLDS